MAELVQADATATKKFFVDMLVRDIGVDAAILDLVDNSVDAARAAAVDVSDLSQFRVEVKIDKDEFTIEDNCGGISIPTATHYAFRFGRDPEYTPDPNAKIGEFGIGMKRAVFRLGRRFTVDSSTKESRFVTDVNIEEWREEPGPWQFPMDISQSPKDEAGTKIVVSGLRDSVSESFAGINYTDGIAANVAERHNEPLRAGLQIIVNLEPVSAGLHTVLEGPGVKAEHTEIPLVSGGHHVNLRIVAGIGSRRGRAGESGWYVYCNGRLVLKADKTEVTGWGLEEPDATSGAPPAWHQQYQRFRGFVFFTSDFPGALPWTTTKDEIDESSDVYVHARAKMGDMIRKFAKYTTEQKKERELFNETSGQTKKHIEDAVEASKPVDVNDVQPGEFKVPDIVEQPTTPLGPTMTEIRFRAPELQVEELMEALDLRSKRQVGEMAFERFYTKEIR